MESVLMLTVEPDEMLSAPRLPFEVTMPAWTQAFPTTNDNSIATATTTFCHLITHPL